MSWSDREREIIEQSGLQVFVGPDGRGGEIESYGRLLDETYVIVTKRGRDNWNVTQRYRDTNKLLFRQGGLELTEAIALANAREDLGEDTPWAPRDEDDRY